ncbi:MAG TPA: helix-turn-helix domain-containing protein [Candidatus Aphodousia gallistercoris]|nr:helix-turn-helix domain-containing protein [Candidatus Aphodousia gallistercoris]
MGTRKLYTKQEKQSVLRAFRKGAIPAEVSRKTGHPINAVLKWHRLFLQEDYSWARHDDEDYTLRQKALLLFKEGKGYKYVARVLGLPASQTKYWQGQYKAGRENFFAKGSTAPRTYPLSVRQALVEQFLQSNLSKKEFCRQAGIAVSTLNIWLSADK